MGSWDSRRFLKMRVSGIENCETRRRRLHCDDDQRAQYLKMGERSARIDKAYEK